MKLSDLRPCDNCGGNISPTFYVVRTTLAIITPAANQVLGLHQYLGGKSLALAEVMAPEPDCVKVCADEDPRAQTELFLCTRCFTSHCIDLAVLTEARNAKET